MPGNEIGDRIHNFFQQGNLSHGRHHLAEGNGPALNSNVCVGDERQINRTVNSKNSNTQHSDTERGQRNQLSQGPYGSSFAQLDLRPEFGKNQAAGQQLVFNGFMHAPRVAHARRTEENLLGVDTEPDQSNLTLRGFSAFETQPRGGHQPPSTSSASVGTAEFPTNFYFFGGQQQMSGQQPGMLQSLPSQQPGISDAQLLQQQVMLKQMHELQRQQQLQQLGALQRNSPNQIPSLPNQVAGNHSSALVNSSPMHDTSNHPRSSQLTIGNTNWLPCGVSRSDQGYSNRFMIRPEQGRAMRMMDLAPHQVSHSLYGVPVSDARPTSPFTHILPDKAGTHQVLFHSNSSSGSQHAAFPEDGNTTDGIVAARSASEGKISLQHAAGEDPGYVVNMQNADQAQHSNAPTDLGRKQDLIGSSESSLPEKFIKPAASSQATVALDPTEEKILFGSDDNIWEAFGGSLATDIDNCLDGAFPAVQSGSWSALMQSAVAESSNGDIGEEGEWSGLGVQTSVSLTGSQQFHVLPESGKEPARADGGSNAHSSSRIHQSVLSHSTEGLQTGSGQWSSEEGNKWQDHTQLKIPGKGSQVSQNVYSSAEFKAYPVPSTWIHQQSTSSHVSQPCNRASNLSTDDLSRTVNVNRDQRAVFSRLDSMPNLNAESSQVKLSGDGTPHSSSNKRVSYEHGQKPSGNHGFDFWGSVSSVKSGVDGSGKYPQGPQILESTVNSSDRFESCDADNVDKRENCIDIQASSLPHALAGVLRENICLDAGDSKKTSGDNYISSGPHGWKTPKPRRKFQYHPMGDVNMDREQAYGIKDTMQSQAMNKHVNRPLQSSQNMLELLQKVDQSKEQNMTWQISSNDRSRLPVMPKAEALDGTVGFIQKQTSASQGFGLRLAPPCHGIQAVNFAVASQCSSQAADSPSPTQGKGERNHAWLVPAASVHSSPSMHSGQPRESRSSGAAILRQSNRDASQCNMIGTISAAFATDSQYIGSLPQDQRMADAGATMIHPQLSNTSVDALPTQGKQIDDTHDRSQCNDSAQITSASTANMSNIFPTPGETGQLPTMERSGNKVSAVCQHMPGITQNSNFPGLPSLSNNISTPEDSSGSQCCNVSNLLKFHVEPNQERGLCPPQKQDDQVCLNKVSIVNSGDPSAMGRKYLGEVDTAQNIPEKETFVAQLSTTSPSCSATQRDIEAFGRDLKPNKLHDNYSLLHQVQAMKSLSMDPSNRDVKVFRGPNTGSDSAGKMGRQFSGTLNSMDRNASLSCTPVSSGDANMPTSSPEASSARDQYGTLEIEQLSAMHDAQRALNVSAAEQLIIGHSFQSLVRDNSREQVNAVRDTCEITNVWQSATTCIQDQQLSAHHGLATGFSTHPVVASRPKKRKIATGVLLPWHAELYLGSEKLQNTSSAEADWARATNHLIEKVEDEADVNEDVSCVVRPKRRLVLTTQLMQQLFHPPQMAILSLDASSNYDIVAYVVARLGLGDTCSQLGYLESKYPERLDKGNLSSEKLKTSGRISDQYFVKMVEDFINRARKLESELLRLDKRASMLDLRLECQDLERFSVINRFAKFHGRGKVDGAESSSASSSSVTGQKYYPQRYVTALPLPRNLPDRVQCLSL